MEKLRHLLGKYSDGKISLKEWFELSEKINDRQNQEVEATLRKEWEQQLEAEEIQTKNLMPVLHEIHHRIRLNESRPVSNFRKWWQGFQKVAAILIIPLLVGFFVLFYSQAKNFTANDSYAEIQCPMGARTKFILPDGSTGFLNSGSTLKFPLVYNRQRTVDLSGEAWFDVRRIDKKPFHVHTKYLNIEVKGDILNVSANENEHTEEVVLQQGHINVFSREGKPLASLSSDEQLIFDTDQQTVTTVKVDASLYSAWKEGKLIFKNETMKQVLQRLSRWYNTEFVWTDNQSPDDYNLQVTFVDEPLEEVLKFISDKTTLKYKEEARTINNDGIFNRRKITIQAQQANLGQLK